MFRVAHGTAVMKPHDEEIVEMHRFGVIVLSSYFRSRLSQRALEERNIVMFDRGKLSCLRFCSNLLGLRLHEIAHLASSRESFDRVTRNLSNKI